MPNVNIWLQKGTDLTYRRAIADSVHRAMNTALGTPPDDFFAAMYELEAENYYFDRNYFGIARSEKFVTIQLFFNARPAVVKDRLFQQIAANLVESPGLLPEDIMISICEVAPENWYIKGREIDPATGTDARMS